jgi:hypothetical protein
MIIFQFPKSSFKFFLNLERQVQAGSWWFMPIILATWKAEIGRTVIQGKPGQTVQESQLQNNQSKMDWRYGSRRRSICFASMKL